MDFLVVTAVEFEHSCTEARELILYNFSIFRLISKLFIFFFFQPEDQTRVLMLKYVLHTFIFRQVLPKSPNCPGSAQLCGPPASTSKNGGIIGVHHHACSRAFVLEVYFARLEGLFQLFANTFSLFFWLLLFLLRKLSSLASKLIVKEPFYQESILMVTDMSPGGKVYILGLQCLS